MGYFPEDTLRRVMMAVFVVLAIVELTRGSWFFVVDVLFALSLSPKILASVIGVFKRKDWSSLRRDGVRACRMCNGSWIIAWIDSDLTNH